MAGSLTEADAILIGCVKTKHARPMAAKDLYCSPLFHRRRRYAEATGKPWVILSALYGLVTPDQLIPPYEVTLSDLPRIRREVWAAMVVVSLKTWLTSLDGKLLELHMGIPYQRLLWARLEKAGAKPVYPLRGLGMGEQLRWYTEQREAKQ